ncbi:hypothetical protein [Nonomuraea soli]|uniref:Secreted protein n=1 Tax=Nonomuraea soli TaxID=1032476 RepID=A0A7W0CD92_9ACTN|nr:hypothetical protein [Nonomuraea soli]MBA2889024.1 hypothetical protein [Nonomuraea soli]
MKGSWWTPRMLIAVIAAVSLVAFAQSGGAGTLRQAQEAVHVQASESWAAPATTPPVAAREHLGAGWHLTRPLTRQPAPQPPSPPRASWPDSGEFRDPQQSSYLTAGPRSPPMS